MRRLTPWVLVAVVLLGGSSARAQVRVSMHDGRVSVVAHDATVRQILAEWARVGQTRFVNADRVPGGPVSIELTDVPEEQALDILLRSVSGYVAAPRPFVAAAISRVRSRAGAPHQRGTGRHGPLARHRSAGRADVPAGRNAIRPTATATSRDGRRRGRRAGARCGRAARERTGLLAVPATAIDRGAAGHAAARADRAAAGQRARDVSAVSRRVHWSRAGRAGAGHGHPRPPAARPGARATAVAQPPRRPIAGSACQLPTK